MKHTAPTVEPEAGKDDALSAYLTDVETIASATPPEGFVDPHIEDQIERQNRSDQIDQEEGGIFPADPDAVPGAPTDEDIERGMIVDDPDLDDDAQQGTPEQQAPTDPIEATVAALRAANPNLTLKAALELAEKAIAVEASSENDETPVPPAVTDLRAELKSLKAQHLKMTREYADDADFEEVEKRILEIEGDLIPAAEQYAQRQQQEVARSYEAFADQAIALYPDAAKEGSQLYNRMAEIHASLEANNDPLVNSPEKALKIAQMAAAELAIAPKRLASTPVKPGTRSPAPMTRPIGDAHARTATPRTTRVEQAIDSINSPEAFEAFIGVG